MLNELERIYLKQEEPNQSCLLALREIILDFNENLNESVKYGMPFFSHGKKMFCYFWFDKKTKHPYIGFAEGYRMHHPTLVIGNRTRIKIFPVHPEEDIPIKALHEVLQEAVQLY